MKIEVLKLQQLKPDPQNARLHDDDNLGAIMGSLDKFGQRKPIVIDQDGTIVAGNGTYEAAKRLGWAEIEAVRVPSEWDDNTIKAIALADNRTAELATWNHEVLATTILELQEVDFDIEAIGFEVPELPSGDEWANTFDATSSDRKELRQITFTLHADQVETIDRALELSKSFGEFGDTGNSNANGNALARICELWIGSNQ